MIMEAFQEKGLELNDVNGAYQEGSLLAQTFSEGGKRVSTNNAFIQPIRYKRKNFKVRVESEVYEILINKNKVAYGVKYTRHGKVHSAFARKEVIVSAGSINSPKLLMLSGIGPKEHLLELKIDVKQDLAVGKNLQDHVSYNGYILALPNTTSTLVDHEELLREVEDYKRMKYKNGPLSTMGPINTAAFFKSDFRLPAPDLQIQLSYAVVKDFLDEPGNYNSLDKFPDSFYDGMYPRIRNLVPKSRGRLYLNSSDPHGPPVLHVNYYEDPLDMIPIIKGSRFFLSFENTKAFKSRGAYFVKTPLPACKDYQWGTDDYTVCLAKSYTSTAYHPVGTCKMGPKWDKEAVVDPKLRVYGISGLRVVDASIMPFVVRGNTNAPAMMIGEKAVSFIIEEWRDRR